MNFSRGEYFAKAYIHPLAPALILPLAADSDLQSGATKPAIALLGGETRPIVVVHSGANAPLHSYTAVDYRSSKFWIEDSDFDSKYALSLVQELMALAEVSDISHALVVTTG